MPKNTRGYEDPAAKGGAGDPPGGKAAKEPSRGYSDGNKDTGKAHGPAIDNKGAGKAGGYDQAGIGSDTSRGGFSKKKRYPG